MSIALLTCVRNCAILKILKKETRLINYLTYLPVFDKLTKSQQDTLTSSSFVRKFGKGELLHNGSQNCTGLLLVLSVKFVLLLYLIMAERLRCTAFLSEIFAFSLRLVL